MDVIVDNEYGRALVPWRHYRLTHMDGYMFTMPDSQTYNITWLNPDAHRLVMCMKCSKINNNVYVILVVVWYIK